MKIVSSNLAQGEVCNIMQYSLLLAAGRWFSPGTPVSSTNKTDRHDVTENIVESGVNHQKNLNPNTFIYYYCIFWWSIHIVDQNPKYTHKSVLNLIVLNTNIIIEECFLSMKLLHRLVEITSARCTEISLFLTFCFSFSFIYRVRVHVSIQSYGNNNFHMSAQYTLIIV